MFRTKFMKAIATINFKGGVGKTTVTWLLAKYAAEEMGKRVLIVDVDAQMSLTLAVTIQPHSSENRNDTGGDFIPGFEEWYTQHREGKRSIHHALEKYEDYARGRVKHFDFPINSSFIYEFSPKLHFIPSVVDLYWTALEVFDPVATKDFIRTMLGKIEHAHSERYKYDYVFFDCPPSFSILSNSVLSCSSSILIPVNPDVFASRGVELMLEGLSMKITPWPKPKIAAFMNKAGYNTRWGLFKRTSYYAYEVQQVIEANQKKGIPISWIDAFIPEYKDIGRAIPVGQFPNDFKGFFKKLWAKLESDLNI